MDNTYLENYDFFVPEDLMAQKPCERRDSSKLLICNKKKEFVKEQFSNICDHIPENSLLIFNDSKVFPCRLFAKKATGGKVEIFLLEYPKEDDQVVTLKALVKPLKKVKKGDTLFFEENLSAHILDISSDSSSPVVEISFNKSAIEVSTFIQKTGHVPLPPYIKRSHLSKEQADFDKSRYQTIYAKNTGSVAAPTAGLHFTSSLFEKFKAKNIRSAHITLHVGMGTFLPIRSQKIADHHMHTEQYVVPSKTLQEIRKAQENYNPIIVVGTTTLRCLESFYLQAQKNEDTLQQQSDKLLSTNLYIYPQKDLYKPWCCDALITNFHQPKSSLFLLIHSLIGYKATMSMYDFAVKNNYRFFSYGDSNLIWL